MRGCHCRDCMEWSKECECPNCAEKYICCKERQDCPFPPSPPPKNKTMKAIIEFNGDDYFLPDR